MIKSNQMNYISTCVSPIGDITLGSDGESLIGLWFNGQKYDRSEFKGKAPEFADLPVFDEAKEWLNVYFQGKMPSFTPRIKVTGSEFKRLVADILLAIPFGCTTTYGKIAKEAAKRLGKQSMSAQAVGGAVARNPIALIIPCHRVVGAKGGLTGYAGGIERKKFLLNLEHGDSSPLFTHRQTVAF